MSRLTAKEWQLKTKTKRRKKAAINPYLNFNGNTEEAFNFYKSVFGREFLALMRFKDNPGLRANVRKRQGTDNARGFIDRQR